MRQIRILWIAVFTALMLNGCFDAIEITERHLVTVTGVDCQDELYRIIVEYHAGESQTLQQRSSKSQSKVATGEGKSFTEARASLDRRMDEAVYIGAVRALVFTQAYAKEGIEEYLNRLRGIREYRKTINVFTTTTNIDALLDSQMLQIQNVGFYLEHQCEQLRNNGMDKDHSISSVLEDISTPNTAFFVDNVDIRENQIERTGYSIFKNGKMEGVVSREGIAGMNYIVIPKAYKEYTFLFDGVKVALSSEIKRKKITPTYYTDGSITFGIDIALKGEIIYLSQMVKLTDAQHLAIGEKVSALAKQEILSAIETSQKEFKCDYLDFYKYFRAKYNAAFSEMNWNEQYETAKFEVYVEAEVAPGNFINYELTGG